MALQIDRSIILPKIERKVKGRRIYSSYQDQVSSLADETITLCQEWIDTKQYAGKEIDTRDGCRRSMYNYTLDNINLRDKNKKNVIFINYSKCRNYKILFISSEVKTQKKGSFCSPLFHIVMLCD